MLSFFSWLGEIRSTVNLAGLLLAAAGVSVLLAAAVFLLTRPRYRRVGPLFTPAESKFLRVLDRATDGRVRVFGKVRLADMVTVHQRFSIRKFWKLYAPLAQKHLDYVLIDPKDYQVKLAIELDDRSHDRRNRRKRDDYVNRVMRKAGIPLLRFPVRGRYNVDEVREDILRKLG